MDKSAITIITDCTVASGETTTLANCTAVDASRSTQLIFTVQGTFHASATDGATLYIYTSTDGTTYDSKAWDSLDIENVREVGYTSGDYEWMYDETVTAAAAGTGTVVGWTLTSGAWGDGDAAGVVYLKDISGTFTDTQSLTGGTSSCSAIQSGSIAAHSFHVTSYSTCVSPLYLKCRLHNKSTTQSITNASVIAVKQNI